MSFTSIVKNEISKLDSNEMEYISELSAIFRNIGIIDKKIKITTENASVARRIFNLVKEIYQINAKVIVRKGYNFNKAYHYILEISHNVSIILNDLSLLQNNRFLSIPAEYIVDDAETEKSYLRGLFMAIGSVNDPKKSRYHLEFVVNEKDYAEFINGLLNKYLLNSKIIIRDNKYMIYIKEAEKIGDFLRIIKANTAVLYFEDIRIYRDHKNMTNRLNNCEQANVDKIIQTATNQVADIKIIESIGGLDLLDDKIKTVATYRLKYPDASLSELSEIISLETSNKITKSGLYHRFKKITALANKIRDKEDNLT
ncbi:MAG: DNA-binding protein WhiA [Bacilli bacterium]|nr:DNA-binding protein WhiA [Bacilli bacterium]MDD4282325.1 DNA-binding protein WhiA [Bacilli bacterium]MDD4718329.1 DNA-binding protein WhiA [Bacilli bacterium]